MEVGNLYRIDYGDERGFGPPAMFLGFSDSCRVDPEWARMMCQLTLRTFESHIDYIYPIKRKKLLTETTKSDNV